jgi:hypothetical protein
MKAPRYAQGLVVSALAIGMVVGSMPAHAAPASRGGEAKGKAGEAPKGKAEGEAGTPPEEGAGTPPEGEAGTPPEGEAGTPPPEGDAGTPPPEGEAGTPPEVETPTEPEPEPPEPEPEPAITVQPRAVEPSVQTHALPGGAAPREVVVDPRRLRSDERLLFRAGLLSLGVAAAAVVPTVIGLQQAYVAEQDFDDERARTMTALGIGAGVAAGAYAITGVVLLGLGARQRAQRRAAVAPAVGPGQLGAVLRARF